MTTQLEVIITVTTMATITRLEVTVMVTITRREVAVMATITQLHTATEEVVGVSS